MLNLYLCENDPVQLNFWKQEIEKILLMREEDCELYCWTTNPEELLAYLQTSDSTGLYFLDIDLDTDMDGLELAARIRQLDPRGFLVFVTTHGEAAPLTFKHKLEAMDFILKDSSTPLLDQFSACIQQAAVLYKRQLQQQKKLLRLQLGHVSLTMDQDDIYYISSGSGSHKLTIHTLNGTRILNGTLSGIAACLDDSFFPCSRSVIVNLHKIREYHAQKRLLTLVNDEILAVSFRQAGGLLKEIKARHIRLAEPD